ncbi:MAG TPA: zf-HC2 domain-containing protein [Bacteroidales bacterium]|nr:zf-HC2 domain-containing protein [Bacteroidales bacterium]
MICKNFKNNILNYYYGESEPDTAREMKEHLATCHECAVLFQQLTGVLGSADHIKEAAPNPFFYTRLSAKIHNQKPVSIYTRMITRLVQPLMAACLAALGIFIGVKIAGNLSENYFVETKSTQSEVAEMQLANEYFPKSGDEELIETFYLNDK